MSDGLTHVFWLSQAAAIIAAFTADAGPLRWCAIAWVALFGLLVSLSNWGYLIIQARNGGQGPSFVPFVGAAFLVTAGAAVPVDSLRLWAPIGILLDPTPAIHLIGSFGEWRRRRRDG